MLVWYSRDAKTRAVKARRKVCRRELCSAVGRDGGPEPRVSVHRGEYFMSCLQSQATGKGSPRLRRWYTYST